MRKQRKVLLIASALVTSLAAASVVLAHDSRDRGMMGRDGMMRNGGMMGKMGAMMRMKGHCGQMMQESTQLPNDQWRKTPSAPEKNS